MLNLKTLLTKVLDNQKFYSKKITSSDLATTTYFEIQSTHSFWIQRLGRLVVINVDLNKKAVVCSSVTRHFIIPYGYRPNHAILDNVAPQDSSDARPVMIYIQTNGDFNFFTNNDKGGRITASIVYFTNDDFPS